VSRGPSASAVFFVLFLYIVFWTAWRRIFLVLMSNCWMRIPAGSALPSKQCCLLLRSGRVAMFCDEHVYLSVCLFVRLSVCLSIHVHNSKTVQPNFSKYLCMLPVALARSFSDGVAICYVILVFTGDVMFSCHGMTYSRMDSHGIV